MLDTNNTHCSNNDVNTKPWHRDSEPIAVVGMGEMKTLMCSDAG